MCWCVEVGVGNVDLLMCWSVEVGVGVLKSVLVCRCVSVLKSVVVC